MNKINFDIYNIVAPKEVKPDENGNYVFEIVSKETGEPKGQLIIPYKQPSTPNLLDNKDVYDGNVLWNIKIYKDE